MTATSTTRYPQVNRMICCVVIHSSSRPSAELTGRRESKHSSPYQASYETRSRRSRPTICYGALPWGHALSGLAALTHSLSHDEPSDKIPIVSRICSLVIVDNGAFSAIDVFTQL